MPTLATIAAFAAASLLLLIIPGPAVLYVVNRSVSDGRQAGLAGVAGLSLGNLVHAIAAAVGLSAVLATSATAFNTVKWLGAAYLVYVGVRTLIRPPHTIAAEQPEVSVRRSFTQGVVVNVLNPKVALFFLSFLPQFIHPAAGRPGLQALVLGLVFVSIGFCTDGTYSLVSSHLRHVLLRGKALPFVQRWVAGTVFIGLGVAAATVSATHVRTPTTRRG
ncbi:MAG TPA: LysE family translocator [Ilumatobacteraceae bacterium]|nr:LysE family translocator [Ilumatobacteraceae bacterium]HRB03664.1 LysE family translocator [Ilumatobacteraceae bacterium]